VRELIEVQVAGLAAKKASEDNIMAMEEACNALANSEADLQERTLADLQFHRTLAASCGNEIYGFVLDSLHKGLIEVRRRNLVSGEALNEAVESHRAILEAVRAGDPMAAQQAMSAHLADGLQYWQNQ
jgi:GntR family transcriptional repressor for pyruvate dehydrogenase complex